MSYYEFFTSCLRTAQEKYQELLNTPRARGSHLDDEIKELIEKVRTAKEWEDITEEQAIYLTNEFKKIDFTKLSQARAEKKKGEKYNVGFRYYR